MNKPENVRILKAASAKVKSLLDSTRSMLEDTYLAALKFKAEGKGWQSNLPKQKVVPIQRIHQDDLSLERFLEDFAIPRVPVIITGLNMSTEMWTLEHIKKKCGSQMAMLNKRDPNATSWGKLVE